MTTTRTTEDHQQREASDVRQVVGDAADSLASGARDCTEYYVKEPAKDLFSLAKDYAKEKPDIAAVWAFGLGVLVGWKLKP